MDSNAKNNGRRKNAAAAMPENTAIALEIIESIEQLQKLSVSNQEAAHLLEKILQELPNKRLNINTASLEA